MKKIILAIFTIIIALAIFGCGKVQQASGGGGGGGSSGGDRGGNTAQTFSIKGNIAGSGSIGTAALSTMAASDMQITLFNFNTGEQQGTYNFGANTSYRIDGLPLGTVFVVVVERGDTRMKNLAWGTNADKGQTKQTDLTPTSTATVEVVSKNAAARAMLAAFGADADIDEAVQTVQDKVNDIYDSNPNDLPTTNTTVDESAKLDAIEAAAIHTYTLTVGISPNIAVSDGVSVNRIPSANAYLKDTRVKLSLLGSGGWTGKSPVWSGIGSSIYDTTDTAHIVMDNNKFVTANVTRQGVLEIPDVLLFSNSEVAGYFSVLPNPNNKTFYSLTDGGGKNFKIWRYFYDEGQIVELTVHGQAGVGYDLGVWENPPPDHDWPGEEDEEDISWNEIYDGNVVTLTMAYPQAILNFEDFRVLGAIPSSTKTLDGNSDDWSGGYAVLFDDTAPLLNRDRNPNAEYAGQPGLKIKLVKIARDTDYLYFLWEQDAGFSAEVSHNYTIGIRPYPYHGIGERTVMLQLWRYDSALVDNPDYPWLSGGDNNGDGFHSQIFYSASAGHPIDTTDTTGIVAGNFYEARVTISVVKAEFPSFSGNEWTIKPQIWRILSPSGKWRGGAADLVRTRVTF
ncbi:hypothetical protein NO2_0380 [Candidatus Termititenax persephonae]|uniref:Uncharacterized protein n=1 Tax=Candidatus Termititenax persephonae TaxID=2218525 RepID=A0A388TFB5_9BACT|nr:hypothetical protein NO2_0380 [Candidatus Termititenax persephonae]